MKKAAKPQTITLAAPHMHGGQKYAKGDTITVSAAQAGWLKKRGVAKTDASNESTSTGD
jgi:hypothetical protein